MVSALLYECLEDYLHPGSATLGVESWVSQPLLCAPRSTMRVPSAVSSACRRLQCSKGSRLHGCRRVPPL
eukprot:2611823-Pleurochrysis_carterae.AAC.1